LRLPCGIVHAAARSARPGSAERAQRRPTGQGWKDAALAGRDAGLARQQSGGQVGGDLLDAHLHALLHAGLDLLGEGLLLAAALLGLLLFLKVVVGRYDFITIQSDRL
jgi:hypothetical protein